MAEEYCGGANWWDSTSTNNRNSTTRFDIAGGGGGSSSTTSTTTLANSSSGGTAGYGWLSETSTTDSAKLDASSLQLMGLGLSSPTMEWNQQQHLLRNPEKAENSFRSMLQEGMGLNTNFQQPEAGGTGGLIFGNTQLHWSRREKLFPNNDDSSPDFKQLGNSGGGGGRGFSLDQHQPQFSPSCSSMESTITCNQQGGFQLDSSSSSSVYGSPSSILQGLIGPDQHQQQQQQQQQQQLNYGGANNTTNNNYQQNYFGMEQNNQWAKVPQFLRSSSPKQQQQQQQQLQFINNAPYWNASAPPVTMPDVRPNFFASLQSPMPTFEEKPKLQSTLETRESSPMSKKGGQEAATKRARNDGASSNLPPFKVRKEKMGDRITALQQLVSPFGKTDTASVLSEAIEYIKFLHEQVSVLSNPYLKSGAPYQQQQPSNEKAKIEQEGPKQDLRSRGLCLVPVSSTFPVTHESTVDFWTPTFGGTFR